MPEDFIKALIISGSGDGEWVAWPKHKGRYMRRIKRPALPDYASLEARLAGPMPAMETRVETEYYELQDWHADETTFHLFVPEGMSPRTAMNRLMNTYSLHAQFKRQER